MIRFACPGCNATFSVGDEKAGKTGKCPKCQSQFVIPEAEGGPAPSSPPPPPPVSDDVEIAPCPGCQARLSVSASDVGVDVECPYCKTVYTAKRFGATQQPKPRRDDNDAIAMVDADRPKSPRRPRDDEEEAPRSRRRDRDDDDDEDTRPSRRRRDDDEDEEDRPRRKKRRRRSAPATSSAASTALVLGIISLFVWCIPCLGWIIGGLAIKYGNRAKEETDGEVGNPAVVMGTISVILSFLMFFANIVLRFMNK